MVINCHINFSVPFEFKFKFPKLAKEGLQSFSILHGISPKNETWHIALFQHVKHFKNVTLGDQCHFKWGVVQIEFELNLNAPTIISAKLVQINFIKSEINQGSQILFL